MLSFNEYVDKREFYRLKAEHEIKNGNEMEAEYAIGVIRGLDLAFQEGTAKSKCLDLREKSIVLRILKVLNNSIKLLRLVKLIKFVLDSGQTLSFGKENF